jgi:hypothetical protein
VTRSQTLMPIGGLARLSRLSVKALRLYDAERLLEPAWVDPDSGYRYSRAEQVRTATTIALLRDTFALTAGILGADPVDGAEEHVLPAGAWASTLHVGPYEELPMAYVALLEHLRERGHEPRAPMLETYLTDPIAAEPSELVTRVAVAMAPAGADAPE